jgi:hypothetical protein
LNSCPYRANLYSCYRPHFLRLKRDDNYSDTGGVIDSKTPTLALKEWQKTRQELLLKRVYYQTGLDT